MNDLACGDQAVIPVVYRPRVAGHATASCRLRISGWDNDIGNLQDWYREA